MNNVISHHNEDIKPQTIAELCDSIYAAIKPQYRHIYQKVVDAFAQHTKEGTLDEKMGKMLILFAKMSKKYKENNNSFSVVADMVPKYIKYRYLKGRVNPQYVDQRASLVGSLLHNTLTLDLENIPQKIREIKRSSKKLEKQATKLQQQSSDEMIEVLSLDDEADFPLVRLDANARGHKVYIPEKDELEYR